jgi:hypothetical protein
LNADKQSPIWTWRFDIWRQVFGSLIVLNSGVFKLGERVREKFIDTELEGTLRLSAMWENFLETPRMSTKYLQDFGEFQLALCCLEGQNITDVFSNLLDRWLYEGGPSNLPPYMKGFQKLGRRLALKNNIPLLARCWHMLYNQKLFQIRFASGVTDGFREAGNVTGVLEMGLAMGNQLELAEFASLFGISYR